ncbi:YVTN family beta-propeller protein [Leifsonia sp. AK011]|uniref:cell wall-binding repeat-containing protein n=1 Tax=Leifsonia sp. AK011 TaxID=2723075 RepID=UPI0015C80987|nr:cell wall-binding repeat-containing protein [Leifsonia sp. AK011]NYF09841.1 YVTN family beta-propeller protein [Leifsonia sp. AK011]
MTRTTAPRIAVASVALLAIGALFAAPLAASAYGTTDLIAVGEGSQMVAFSPDGSTAYVTNRDSNSVSVIDVATSAETDEIPVGTEPKGLAISPDGSEVWVAVLGSITETDITIIETSDLSTTAISSGGNGPYAVEFDAAGAYAYVSNYLSSSVAKIDAATRSVVDTVSLPDTYPEDIALGVEEQTLYVTLSAVDGVARVSTSTLDEIGSPIAVGDFPVGIELSPSESELWVTNNSASSVSVISTTSNTVVGTISTNPAPTDVVFDSDGYGWISSNASDVLQRIDPVSRTIVSTIPLLDSPFGLAVHPTERLIYTATGTDVTVVELTSERVAGADRYATAVRASEAAFEPGVETVYIATGLNYPDALAAGAVAAKSASPILLTRPDALPTVVANELTRLDPDNIVVLGGTGTVTSSVQNALSAYGTVSRIAGTNRYDTARQLVQSAQFTQVDQVYIATGNNFPDALAAGAAAASGGDPVILVNGTASSLDSATLSLIQSTGAPKAVILGQTNAVSSGIEDQLGQSYEVERLAGTTRYETAVLVNQYAFGGASTALLATGANFPDALAGTPLANATSAPLYVVRTDCVPAGVLSEFDRLGTSRVILLGGTPTLSVEVEDLTPCAS